MPIGDPVSLARRLPPRKRPRLRAAFLLKPEMFDLSYGRECVQAIAAHAIVLGDGRSLARGEWSPRMAEANVVFTGWDSPRFERPLLDRLPKLEAVFHAGGTIRPLVTDSFWRRGIIITTAAAANAVPVAEYTLAAIIFGLKQAWTLNRALLQTRAFPTTRPHVRGMCGATVGLVSLGAIGRLVRERLRSFEVHVIAYDPLLSATEFSALEVEPVPLPVLMSRADVVSLHTPLHAGTEGLISGELLSRLKLNATFINTARGGLVRQPDLIAFLRRRPDVQAVLDVTVPEPPARNSALFELPNVFLTPHIAGSLGSECRRLGRLMIEEFERFMRGEPLRHAVTREQAQRRT